MKQTDPQFKLRLTPELKARLEESAAQRDRTLTAEIVDRIESTYAAEQNLKELGPSLSRMESLVSQRERELRDAVRLVGPVVMKAANGLNDSNPMPGDPHGHTVGYWKSIFDPVVNGIDQSTLKPADQLSLAITWGRMMMAAKGLDEQPSKETK